MRLMDLNDEQRFRVRHTIREYGYEAIDALIGLAKERNLEMPEMIQVFSEEIRTEAKHFGKEKAPEMVATSTEAKEIISENKSITTNPENPDPAKLIASDGMIAVGVVGSVLVGLVIAGAVYVLGDY